MAFVQSQFLHRRRLAAALYLRLEEESQMPDNTIRRVAAVLALLVAAPLASPAAAAEAKPPVCSDPKHREFDFWAGTWRVHGANNAVAGDNTITIEQSGCVLVEHWRSAGGGTGQSLNYYDPVARRWKQRWVGMGLILEMQGGMEAGSMVLEGPLHYVQTQRTTLLRGTWTLLPDGRVRQHFIESADGGKTWTDWFDGYYSKAQ
jgi:hypothetical protein